ncbi:MAG: ribosome small subunit-dependent GTPase A [Pseudomonadota bacterium]
MSMHRHIETMNAAPTTGGLERLGWTSHFQNQMRPTRDAASTPARVVGVRRNGFLVMNGDKAWRVTAAGRLRHQFQEAYPVVGDWVLTADTVITSVLERKNALVRGAAGARGRKDGRPASAQAMAANLDAVVIVCGLDRDFNLRRIERYLTLVYSCGMSPVLVLTKADLHPDPERFETTVAEVALGVPVQLVSSLDGRGLPALAARLKPGETATMIGSSGAGKSTLLNLLYGKALQATGDVSERVGKGKHITTRRDLIVLPNGSMVIDNPGIREIAFWDDDAGLETAFPDIDRLAAGCRFSDCSHTREPGCRVLQAVDADEVSPGRLESFRKMKREMTYLSQRQHKSADRVEKERWKSVAVKIKTINKDRC